MSDSKEPTAVPAEAVPATEADATDLTSSPPAVISATAAAKNGGMGLEWNCGVAMLFITVLFGVLGVFSMHFFNRVEFNNCQSAVQMYADIQLHVPIEAKVVEAAHDRVACLVMRYDSLYRSWGTNITTCGQPFDSMNREKLVASISDEYMQTHVQTSQFIDKVNSRYNEFHTVHHTCLSHLKRLPKQP